MTNISNPFLESINQRVDCFLLHKFWESHDTNKYFMIHFLHYKLSEQYLQLNEIHFINFLRIYNQRILINITVDLIGCCLSNITSELELLPLLSTYVVAKFVYIWSCIWSLDRLRKVHHQRVFIHNLILLTYHCLDKFI